MKSKAKQLADKYGGKWKYDGQASWWCDDNKRHVSRVSTCLCDDICSCRRAYCLYGDGSPILINFPIGRNILMDIFTQKKRG